MRELFSNITMWQFNNVIYQEGAPFRHSLHYLLLYKIQLID